MFDIGDKRLRYPKPFGDIVLRPFGNLNCIIFFCGNWVISWVVRASRSVAAAFFVAVSIVVFSRSEPKVFWFDTGLVVASVANAHSLWNWTLKKPVSNTVRLVRLAAFNCKSAIPVLAFRREPHPAPVSLIHLFHKSLQHHFILHLVGSSVK